MAIRRLNEYKKEVETKTVRLLEVLTNQGVEIARAKVVELDAVDTGDLMSSITAYVSPLLNLGVIKVTNDHAVFIEFGTGPIGAASSHPTGMGTYRGNGWYTKADGKDMFSKYGWTPIELSNGDIIYYTEGQPSKPFMWQTAKELELRVTQVAKEVFA